jgi:hypothetical protein
MMRYLFFSDTFLKTDLESISFGDRAQETGLVRYLVC